jgi:hypothetical protein
MLREWFDLSLLVLGDKKNVGVRLHTAGEYEVWGGNACVASKWRCMTLERVQTKELPSLTDVLIIYMKSNEIETISTWNWRQNNNIT